MGLRNELRYVLQIAWRYVLARKQAFVRVGSFFATLGMALGVAALVTAMSVTGGFLAEYRDKVLGVNAHVLALKYATDFRDYREAMAKAAAIPGVTGVAPFTIQPMMLTRGDRSATGITLKGIDPDSSFRVLDLPRYIVSGTLDGLRLPGAAPPVAASERLLLELEKQTNNASIEALSAQRGRAEILPGHFPSSGGSVARDLLPSGGYRSRLPDVDQLPEELDQDPCATLGKGASAAGAPTTLPGIVLGAELARTLVAKVGDCVRVTHPTVSLSFGSHGGRAATVRNFRVLALFSAGFQQYDATFAYVDLYEAQAFMDEGDTVTGVELRVADINDAQRIASELAARLDPGMYQTMSWMELNRGLFTMLRVQQVLGSSVLALIVLVAAFTVVSTLILVVLDRRRETAVLKAMGATRRAVTGIFLLHGLAMGLVGTGAGLLIGYGLCLYLRDVGVPLDPKVYFVSRVPVLLRAHEFLITAAVAVGITLLATWWPSRYAAGLSPAEGLRRR